MSGWSGGGWNGGGWKGGGGGWSNDNWRDGGGGGGGNWRDDNKGGGGRKGDRGNNGKRGGGKGGKVDSAPPPAARGPGEALKPGESIRLNTNDCESGLKLMGGTGSGTRERAQRKADSGTQWAGVRADCGVAAEGLLAFCVWNETGGNLRIGWSMENSKLALGTDRFSWGFGGTATKSHAGNFEKFGQTFGKDDAITCCVDLERRAILYFKNGREIPGDCFTFGKELSGVPLFPHVYTKEATFSISFDGSGGAPPLSGGFKWIAEAQLVPHPTRISGAGPSVTEPAADAGGDAGPKFVLTPYGWRTVEQAGGLTQEWRSSLDAYVRHFTSSLELEYEAERQAVLEKVQKRSTRQLQDEGIGVAGLSAEFDAVYGRVTLWPDGWRMPYLSEIKFGRAVLLSTVDGGVDLEDPKKTISAEVESIRDNTMILSTPYERLPSTGGKDLYRVDLGPNIVANKRIDRMLDELQRCLGVDQAANPRVITCHHVIKDSIKQIDRWDPIEKSSKKVEQLLPVSVETFRYDLHGRHLQTVTTSADIVAYCAYGDQWSFEGDLALLKLKAPVEITAAALISEKNFEEVRALDEVVMVGCPDSSEVPLPTTGHVASLSEVRAGIGLMLSQVFGNPGSSGSAVYRFSPERNQYEVIALHSLTDGRGSLTSLGRGNFLRLAVQAPEIHKFLRSHQLLHLVQPPEEAQGTKSAPPKKAAKTAKTASTGTKTATKAKKKATS